MQKMRKWTPFHTIQTLIVLLGIQLYAEANVGECVDQAIQKQVEPHQSNAGLLGNDRLLLNEWKRQTSAGQVKSYYNTELQTEIYYSATARPDPKTGIVPMIEPRGLHEGDPPPPLIVYFHGSGTKAAGGRVFTQKLNEMSNLGISGLAFDYPEHQKGPQGLDYEDPKLFYAWVARLIAMHRVPGQKVLALGHSYGPNVIAEFMLRQPGVLDAAVLMSPAGFDRPTELWEPIKDKMDFGSTEENAAGGEWAGRLSSQNLWDLPGKIKDLEVFISAKKKMALGLPLTTIEQGMINIEKQAHEVDPQNASIASIPSLELELEHDKKRYEVNRSLFEQAKQINEHRPGGPTRVRVFFGDREEYMPTDDLATVNGLPVVNGSIQKWYKPEESILYSLEQFTPAVRSGMVREPDVGHMIFSKRDSGGNSVFAREVLAALDPKAEKMSPEELKVHINQLTVDAKRFQEEGIHPSEKLAMEYENNPLFREWYNSKNPGNPAASIRHKVRSNNQDKRSEAILKSFSAFMALRLRQVMQNAVNTQQTDPAFYEANKALLEATATELKREYPRLSPEVLTKYLDHLNSQPEAKDHQPHP